MQSRLTMPKQTAVEWLVENLISEPLTELNIQHNVEVQILAKRMEKQQIVDAFVECWKENMPEGYECKQSAEYYYNETFKQE